MNLLKIPCSDDPTNIMYVQPECVQTFFYLDGITTLIIPNMIPVKIEGDITKQLTDAITKGTGGKIIHI